MNGEEVNQRVQRPGGGRPEEGENIARIRKAAPERRKPTQTSGWRDTSHEGNNKDTPRDRSAEKKKRLSIRGRGSGKYEKRRQSWNKNYKRRKARRDNKSTSGSSSAAFSNSDREEDGTDQGHRTDQELD